MELVERFSFPVPAEKLWSHLHDVELIAECMPGAELLRAVGENVYEGRIRFRFGPKVVTFDGTAAFETDEANHVGVLKARGGEANSRSRANAVVNFYVVHGQTPDVSTMELATTMTFQGPIASFAESGGVHVGRQIFSEFAAAFGDRISGSTDAAQGSASAREIGFARVLARSLLHWLRSRMRRSANAEPAAGTGAVAAAGNQLDHHEDKREVTPG